jgi:hypothetical protein
MAKARNTNPNPDPIEKTPSKGGSEIVSKKMRYIGPPQFGKLLLPDNTMIRINAPDEDIRTAVARFPDLVTFFAEEEE